jgi:hypothetical protein
MYYQKSNILDVNSDESDKEFDREYLDDEKIIRTLNGDNPYKKVATISKIS